MTHTFTPPIEGQDKHQANIVETLAHRTSVASVQHDLQLLKLLQQERQQLNAPKEQRPLSFYQHLKALIAKRAEISIEKIQAPSGQIAWRVYNPRTKRSRYAETISEIVVWLESSAY